jgi:hypothetical protein
MIAVVELRELSEQIRPLSDHTKHHMRHAINSISKLSLAETSHCCNRVPDVALPETEQVSRDLDRSGQRFLRSKVVTPKYIERALKTRTQNENTGMNDGPAPYISNPTAVQL